MRTLLFDQGTPEWVDARAGRATASEFTRVFQPTRKTISTAWKAYSCELIAETFLGGPDPWKMEGETADMRRGKECETKARAYYEAVRGLDVQMVGCCIHDNDFWLASPDGLAPDRGLELKCPAARTQVEVLVAGKVPAKHLPQVHGGMIVTGLDRWDYLSYATGLPAFLVTVERSDYTEQLEKVLVDFTDRHFKLLEKIRQERQEFIGSEIERRGSEVPVPMRSFVGDVA